MILSKVRLSVALAILAAALASCSDDATVATPTPNPTTETFTGTLVPSQKVIHPYAATIPGSVATTLTALSGAATVGVGTGVWDGTTCTIGAHSESVSVGQYFLASVPSPQNLCVMVYDTGGVTTSAAYTVTVVHP